MIAIGTLAADVVAVVSVLLASGFSCLNLHLSPWRHVFPAAKNLQIGLSLLPLDFSTGLIMPSVNRSLVLCGCAYLQLSPNLHRKNLQK